MLDAFTVHKGHIKCTVVQKGAHWPSFLVLIFNNAIYVDFKNILYKKSLIRLITGTNLLNKEESKLLANEIAQTLSYQKERIYFNKEESKLFANEVTQTLSISLWPWITCLYVITSRYAAVLFQSLDTTKQCIHIHANLPDLVGIFPILRTAKHHSRFPDWDFKYHPKSRFC